MLVIPRVAIAIISVAAGLGNSINTGKVGGYTLGFFAVTSAFAVTLALLIGEIFRHGIGIGIGIDLSGIEGVFSTEYVSKSKTPTF